jgi:hypothetical protein
MEIDWVDTHVGMLEWTTGELLKRLALVTGTIASLVELRVEARSRAEEAKSQAWGMTGETAARAKELAAKYASTGEQVVQWETEAQLEALREEKEFIVFLVGVKQTELIRG